MAEEAEHYRLSAGFAAELVDTGPSFSVSSWEETAEVSE